MPTVATNFLNLTLMHSGTLPLTSRRSSALQCMSQPRTPPPRRISTKACPRWANPTRSKRADNRRPGAPHGADELPRRSAGPPLEESSPQKLTESGPGITNQRARRPNPGVPPPPTDRIIASLTSHAIGPELQYDAKWQWTPIAIAAPADAFGRSRRPR
jgi:hypothetical protein